jgi:hypothetical protein
MKGGAFENEICKELGRWWSDGQRDDIFRRTAGSGGKATSRWKGGKNTANEYGDISFSDEIGKPFIDRYNIECKTGYASKIKWDVLDIIDSKQKETILEKFWHQCVDDAQKSNRIPLLIFRRNGRQKCICMDYKERNKLGEYVGFLNQREIIVDCGYVLFIYVFSVFLDVVSPEVIKLIQKRKLIAEMK